MTSCGDCRAAKRFLIEKGVVFKEINIEGDSGGCRGCDPGHWGKRSVPTFDIDGRFVPFSPKKLWEALGLSQES